MSTSAIVISILIDALIFGGVVYGILYVRSRFKRKVHEKRTVTERVERRDRMVFTRGDTVYREGNGQQKPSVVSSLGIAPMPAEEGNQVPREDSLEFGIVDPWEVRLNPQQNNHVFGGKKFAK